MTKPESLVTKLFKAKYKPRSNFLTQILVIIRVMSDEAFEAQNS
jgi:hypothetical protein